MTGSVKGCWTPALCATYTMFRSSLDFRVMIWRHFPVLPLLARLQTRLNEVLREYIDFIVRQAVNDGEKRFRDTAFFSYAIISI